MSVEVVEQPQQRVQRIPLSGPCCIMQCCSTSFLDFQDYQCVVLQELPQVGEPVYLCSNNHIHSLRAIHGIARSGRSLNCAACRESLFPRGVATENRLVGSLIGDLPVTCLFCGQSTRRSIHHNSNVCRPPVPSTPPPQQAQAGPPPIAEYKGEEAYLRTEKGESNGTSGVKRSISAHCGVRS